MTLRWSRLLATWFGTGWSPVAPGTCGSFAALPLHWLAASPLPGPHIGVIAIVVVVGIWCAQRIADEAHDPDPPFVVIDEVAGTLIALIAVAADDLVRQVLGVLLFRLFDIVKPWPISRLERFRPTGLGIMADDVAAGIAAAIVLGLLGANAARFPS